MSAGDAEVARLLERLARFRSETPRRACAIDGVEFTAHDVGRGDDVFLVLTGATGVAESSFLTIEGFASRGRAIAPDYPGVPAMTTLVDGIATLLDRLGVGAAHVVGGSYGGLVAQVLVRRHPGRVRSLVLSHTVALDPDGARRRAFVARLIARLPASALRWLLARRLRALIPLGGSPELRFARAHLEEVVRERMSGAEIRAVLARVSSLGALPDPRPEDLDAWPGRILLLLSEDDPATPKPARDRLVSLYPRAEVRTFTGSGHLTSVLQRDAVRSAIEAFHLSHR